MMLVNNNKVVKEKTEIIIKMSQLFSFLQPQQYSYPSIFIYGHRASGKSHVMQVLLKELEVRETFAVSAEWFVRGFKSTNTSHADGQ